MPSKTTPKIETGSSAPRAATQPRSPVVVDLLKQYECGLVSFSGDPNASYERHLVFDHVIQAEHADNRARFEAVARSVRDLLVQRWLKTQETYDRTNPKRVYYLSMEFLIGRSLRNNISNLRIDPLVQAAAQREDVDLEEIEEAEPDAGLGNGGLGRLAACFIDSMATMQIPAVGYGLRYEYGIFRQKIVNGWQIEQPDPWLRHSDPWEVARPNEHVHSALQCAARLDAGKIVTIPGQPMHLIGIPYDRPVVGFGGKAINTLRLWSAASPDFFDFADFSSGDFFGAVVDKVMAETLTRVLYPDDSTPGGRSLRFVQEYFLVACSLADILRTFRRSNDDWHALPDKVAIQLNDTHPSMAVPELMRHLLDYGKLGWDDAWDLTTRTLAYTNHTLLPEALERWPVELFERALPRHLEIIYEINRRFLDDVAKRYPDDEARVTRMSLIEEQPEKRVRMAHLAVVGSHSTNGVAEIHSKLLRTRTLRDFSDMLPDRFRNITNGVTPRRWLLGANPELSSLITDAIGSGWITNLAELQKLRPLADDASFRERFDRAQQSAKRRLVDWLKHATARVVDPASIFDCQIKRIHEYKRQLLNVLHIVVLYNRLRANPKLDVAPRTFFFAGKAAPAYQLAKLIIKLINNVADAIDSDPATKGRLKVLFLPDYNVSVAERLIPAADVSEQISTAGYEASGTSNMKFMMNGALTIGTRDGATIEMAAAAGEDNMYLFGLSAEQVEQNRGWYSPWWHYENEPEIRAALDLLFSDHFCKNELGIFWPIHAALLERGDPYMHLADLTSYSQAHDRLGGEYTDRKLWTRKSILNVACSGHFSSDRSIAQYAGDVWSASACPVP